MSHRVFQAITIFLGLMLISSISLAGGYYSNSDQYASSNPNLQMSDSAYYSHEDEIKYGGHDPIYVFGGMTYSHKIYSGRRTVTRLALTPVTYNIQKHSPEGFIGAEAGVGKIFSEHFDLQAAYIRELSEKKHGTINAMKSIVLMNMSALKLEMGYIFNPDDQFQVIGQVGAEVAEITNQLKLNSLIYSPTEETQVLPNMGAGFVLYFSRYFSMRAHLEYTLRDADTFYDGSSFGAFVGLSYDIT